jgi:DNA-binding LacI/PurR family transcriptional regulator
MIPSETGGSTAASRRVQRRAVPVMADVAALAGVSEMTVSRVLNGHPGVRAATRERVLAAMHAFDYHPNPAAQALVTGRTRVIGVVTLDTTLFGPAATLFGLEQAARGAGYAVSVASVRDLTRESIRDAVSSLHRQGVAGVFVIAPHASAQAGLRAVSSAVPVVAVEAAVVGRLPTVFVDQAAGARLATEHLLHLGHRTVWHLAGPGMWLEAQVRERTWAKTLRAEGAVVPPALVGDWSARSGYELGRRLAREGRATAVFAANDHMALGLYRALGEEALRVPEDVSVVGFDDVPEAAYFMPPLTTVRQDFDEVGRRGLQMLLEYIDGKAELGERRVAIEPALMFRSSTAPPAG